MFAKSAGFPLRNLCNVNEINIAKVCGANTNIETPLRANIPSPSAVRNVRITHYRTHTPFSIHMLKCGDYVPPHAQCFSTITQQLLYTVLITAQNQNIVQMQLSGTLHNTHH